MIIPVIASSIGIVTFLRLMRTALSDPMVRGLVLAMAVVLAVGTVSYNLIEGWSLLDSFYFCGVTLLTIGYGDFTPVTAAGKLFTVAYCFAGVGLFAAGATTIVQRSRLWDRIERRADQNGADEQAGQ